MHRIASLLPLLVATAVNAQITTADTSADNAGPLTMILFAAAFFTGYSNLTPLLPGGNS